jgi:hypothetical protein
VTDLPNFDLSSAQRALAFLIRRGRCGADVAIVDILGAGVFRLEPDAGVVGGFLRLLRASSKFSRIAEAENLPSEFRQRSVDLIFGALHGQQVDQSARAL